MNSTAWRLTCEADLDKQDASVEGQTDCKKHKSRSGVGPFRQVRQTIPQHITMAQQTKGKRS